VNPVGAEFIVPAKRMTRIELKPEGSRTRRYLDHPRRELSRLNISLRLRNLSVKRESMKHVRESLRVHEAVLDGRVQKSRERRCSVFDWFV